MASAPKKFLFEMVTLDGVTKPVKEWCAERGIDPNRVYNRRQRGNNWEESLSKVDMSKNGRSALNRQEVLRNEFRIASMKRGINHHNSVLNAAIVREIRASSESLSSLAKKYKVSKQTISAIKNRVTWKDVHDDLTPSPDGR